MNKIICDIIDKTSNHHFNFERNNNSPIRHLKEQTVSVPESAGLYLVFCPYSFNQVEDHLKFTINGELYSLLYFGKAGGITKRGKIIKQGLKGRLNNVTSDSQRNLIDVKRAIYWNLIMNEFSIDNFCIYFSLHGNPQELEEAIYFFLDNNSKSYPLMNKKRGRH
jgi:hypothetical protein